VIGRISNRVPKSRGASQDFPHGPGQAKSADARKIGLIDRRQVNVDAGQPVATSVTTRGRRSSRLPVPLTWASPVVAVRSKKALRRRRAAVVPVGVGRAVGERLLTAVPLAVDLPLFFHAAQSVLREVQIVEVGGEDVQRRARAGVGFRGVPPLLFRAVEPDVVTADGAERPGSLL
jgi:hypothetical protein